MPLTPLTIISRSALAVPLQHCGQWLWQKGGWLWVLSATAIVIVAYFFSYGFDFTDEGYYLAWINRPFDYPYSLTQFGFVYHPLFTLTQHNVALLRTLTLLLTWGLATLCCAQLLNQTHKSTTFKWGLAMAFATAVLAYYRAWLPTPNYNLLCLQGILLTTWGVLRCLNALKQKHFSWLSALAIGLGGTLTFLAKPTSAVMLAPMVTLALLPLRRTGAWMILSAASIALLGLLSAAISIDGSVEGFIHRLSQAYALSQHSNLGHTLHDILRLDEFRIDLPTGWILATVTAINGLSICSLNRPSNDETPRPTPWILALSITMVVGVLFSSLGLSLLTNPEKPALSPTLNLLLLAIPITSIIFAYVLAKNSKEKSQYIFRKKIRLMAYFALLPVVYSFGTNNNLWVHSASAGVFWVLASLVLLGHVVLTDKRLHFLAVSTLACSLFLASNGIMAPYRQPAPLWKNTETITLFHQHSLLKIHPTWAHYIGSAQTTLQAALNPNLKLFPAKILDLTGQSPGLIVAINGHNAATPWLIGGYPGSETLAQEILDLTPCHHLANSYLLTEPEGYRHLPESLLSTFGAELNRDYQLAGQWVTPIYASGQKQQRTQYLYQPTHPATITNTCIKQRAHHHARMP